MPYKYRPREHRSPMNFPTLGINVEYGDIVDNPALEGNPDFEKVEAKKDKSEKTPAAPAAADPAAEQTGAGDAGRS